LERAARSQKEPSIQDLQPILAKPGKNSDPPYGRWFFVLLAVTTVFRLFYIQWVDLAPDEAYYWTWSRHLQWGYYDHPPMVAFLILVFTTLFGQSEFGVRVGWVLMTTLLSCLLYFMGRLMFRSERTGFYAALLMNLSLLASAGAIIVTPDGPQGLFWALSILFVYLAVTGKGDAWWYGSGIALGLGLLSKYTMILLAPCVFFFLLSYPEGRNWLRRKEPYLAFLLGLAIFSPVILWNAQHDWLSFRFQLSHGLEVKRQVGLRYFGDYWAGQAGLVSPLMFLGILWAMGKSAWLGFRLKKDTFLLLFWTSAPVLLFFAYTSLRSKVEANWPALAYFSALVALAGLAIEEGKEWGRGKRAFAWAAGSDRIGLHGFGPRAADLCGHSHQGPIGILPASFTDGVRWEIDSRKLPDPWTRAGGFSSSPRAISWRARGCFTPGRKFRFTNGTRPNRINHLSPLNSPPREARASSLPRGGTNFPGGWSPFLSPARNWSLSWSGGIRRSCAPIPSGNARASRASGGHP